MSLDAPLPVVVPCGRPGLETDTLARTQERARDAPLPELSWSTLVRPALIPSSTMGCPSCGHPSREAARFCAECATPLIEMFTCPSCGTAHPRSCNDVQRGALRARSGPREAPRVRRLGATVASALR
jgi:hypothetical protein